jgi:FAD/FMN-containing dehydrogenase
MGDGNIHFIPFFSFDEWNAMPDRDGLADQIRRAIDDAAGALRGTFSAEHGIGRTLIGEMSRYKAPVELALMRAVKQAFDPLGLFNPGRVLPPAIAPTSSPSPSQSDATARPRET